MLPHELLHPVADVFQQPSRLIYLNAHALADFDRARTTKGKRMIFNNIVIDAFDPVMYLLGLMTIRCIVVGGFGGRSTPLRLCHAGALLTFYRNCF